MPDLGELTRTFQVASEFHRVAVFKGDAELIEEAQAEMEAARDAMEEEWAKREAERAARAWRDGVFS